LRDDGRGPPRPRERRERTRGAPLRVSFGPSAGVVADAAPAPHTEPAIGSQT